MSRKPTVAKTAGKAGGRQTGSAKAEPAEAPAGQPSAPSAMPPPVIVRATASPPPGQSRQAVRFTTDNLKSSYCNMCNATSTREEVVLNFGLNQNWDQPTAKPDVLEVDLQHRVVLSPFAAKRLSQALGKLVSDYETRYGKLD